MKTFKIFLLVLLPLGVWSQATRSYSNEFMNIGVDAAALGMSNAVVANVDGVSAGYWNPAGLVHLEHQSLALMHSSYFANIANYNYMAYARPLDDRSAIGLSLIRFGVDDILDTTQLIDQQGNVNYDNISLFSAADYGILISYARKLQFLELSYGINAKIIRRIIGDFASSWGVGFDMGIQFKKNNWNFGLMARDITTTFNTWSIDEDKLGAIQAAIPGENQDAPETSELTLPKLQLGVTKLFNFGYDYSLRTEFDLMVRFEQTNDIISTSFASVTPALGFEFGYAQLVYLRGGVGNFQNELQFDDSQEVSFQPNIGLGFKYNGVEIDYALTDIGDQSVALYSNVFSLKIDLSIFK